MKASSILRMMVALVIAAPVSAQTKIKLPTAPAPAIVVEPKTPPERPFHDGRSGLSFQVPAGWGLTRKDREVSTFNLDVPSVNKGAQLKAVANMTFNPFPDSTFSGALFYASVTPDVTDADCSRQASTKSFQAKTETIGGTNYTHGHDEHGGICIESREEIYTASRAGACYRFDLVLNNFCGGDVSGVRDMSPKEIEDVRRRLENILATVQIDKK